MSADVHRFSLLGDIGSILRVPRHLDARHGGNALAFPPLGLQGERFTFWLKVGHDYPLG